jgi:hypothetical protein
MKENEVGGACSTRGRWEKHVQGFGGKSQRKNKDLEDQRVDGRMVPKCTLGRLVGGGGECGMDSPGSGQGPLAGCCECGDEPSGSGSTELIG